MIKVKIKKVVKKKNQKLAKLQRGNGSVLIHNLQYGLDQQMKLQKQNMLISINQFQKILRIL